MMLRVSILGLVAAVFVGAVFSCSQRTGGAEPSANDPVKSSGNGPASTLEIRILAGATDEKAGEFEAYRSALAKDGPASLDEKAKYRWFPVKDPSGYFRNGVESAVKDEHLVVGTFKGDYFVLAHVEEGYVLTNPKGTRWSLRSAQVTEDPLGRPAVCFTLDERGDAKMRMLTRSNLKKELGIFLNGQALSHALINTVVGGDGIITGFSTPEEANEVAKQLEAGIGR